MDDQTDNRDPDLPPVGTPEELEEALKWLEDLTARQGKTADPTNPIPPPSLDSPFHGLIDNEEGDLPDWLRELPKPPETESYDEAEPESRLDWLAKMAQRESIEELPTLEWRRLSEPLQDSLVPEASQLAIELRSDEMLAPPAEEEPPATVYEPAAAPVEAVPAPEAARPDQPEMVEVLEGGQDIHLVEAESDVSTAPPGEDMPPIGTLADEDLVGSITLGQEEELPPLDDLDAAMAWIEELAASQGAPVEEIPTVGDRALASKLMMEAGLSTGDLPLDELGSDSALVENMTPTHPFIEEEDFADTVVLVETMAADQGIELELPEEDEPLAGITAGDAMGDLAVPVEAGAEMAESPPAEELSFDEAMAYLDELAVVKLHENGELEIEPLRGEADEIAAVTVVEVVSEAETPAGDRDDSLSSADAPWAVDALGEADSGVIASEPEEVALPEEATAYSIEGVNMTGEAITDETIMAEEMTRVAPTGEPALEAALSALDEWALPTGQTLAGIAATLDAAHIVPRRDLPSALAWLESVLTPAPAAPAALELDEADLIARMPDDPDEVLAWLEQIAGEETNAPAASDVSPAQHAGGAPVMPATAPGLVDLPEADLFEMPDDPDEAMAWLEGLARGDRPPAAPREPIALVETVGVETAASLPPVSDDEPAKATFPAFDVTPEQPITLEVESFALEAPLALTPAMADVADVEAAESMLPEPEIDAMGEFHSVTPAIAPSPAEGEAAAQPAPAKPIRRRRRRATPEPATSAAAEPAGEERGGEEPRGEEPGEEVPGGEQPAEAIPAEERPAQKPAPKSWIDLLKPLD